MAYHLQRQIENLKRRILEVGEMVESAIAQTIVALINQDPLTAQRVIAEDVEIDRAEVDVEEECLKILALYQPVAIDLRFVVAVLKINNDLERMGDICKNIAKRVLKLAETERFDERYDFRSMAIRAQDMVKSSLDALVRADSLLAHQVRQQDDELDAMRKEMNQRIQQEIRLAPGKTDALMTLNSIVRHLERLGDMATHVAEEVIYMVEGKIVRHQEAE